MMVEELKNLENKRASYALNCIKQVPSDRHKRYRSIALSSGQFIRKSGLVQVLLYYLSKKDCDFVSDVLNSERIKNVVGLNESDKFNRNSSNDQIYVNNYIKSTSEKLLALEQDKVMRITQEALPVIKWLKRFADELLENKETQCPEEKPTITFGKCR